MFLSHCLPLQAQNSYLYRSGKSLLKFAIFSLAFFLQWENWLQMVNYHSWLKSRQLWSSITLGSINQTTNMACKVSFMCGPSLLVYIYIFDHQILINMWINSTLDISLPSVFKLSRLSHLKPLAKLQGE